MAFQSTTNRRSPTTLRACVTLLVALAFGCAEADPRAAVVSAMEAQLAPGVHDVEPPGAPGAAALERLVRLADLATDAGAGAASCCLRLTSGDASNTPRALALVRLDDVDAWTATERERLACAFAASLRVALPSHAVTVALRDVTTYRGVAVSRADGDCAWSDVVSPATLHAAAGSS